MAMSSSRSIFLAAVTIATLVCVAQAQADSQEWLMAHNAVREAVSATIPALVWSNATYAYALSFAESQSAQCLPLISSNGIYGENIAWFNDTTTIPTSAVALWVTEAPNYDYASNSCVGGDCGHFTQVVWSNTTSLGCASVLCNDGGIYFICSYDPAGNVPGERPYILP